MTVREIILGDAPKEIVLGNAPDLLQTITRPVLATDPSSVMIQPAPRAISEEERRIAEDMVAQGVIQAIPPDPLLRKIKKFFVEPGYRGEEITSRVDRYIKAFAQIPAGFGMGVTYTGELLRPELEKLGIKQTGVGEMAEFIGQVFSATRLLKAVGIKTPQGKSLIQRIGRTAPPWMTSGAIDKIVEGIVKKQKPEEVAENVLKESAKRGAEAVAWSGIGYVAGRGLDWAIRRFPEFGAGWNRWIRGKSPERVRAARQEVDEALRIYKETGDRTQWDATRIKYAGITPEGVSRITVAEPLPITDFGKYPLAVRQPLSLSPLEQLRFKAENLARIAEQTGKPSDIQAALEAAQTYRSLEAKEAVVRPIREQFAPAEKPPVAIPPEAVRPTEAKPEAFPPAVAREPPLQPPAVAEGVGEPIKPEYREMMRQALTESKTVVPIVKAEISEQRARIAGAIKPKIKSMQAKGLPTEEAVKRSIPPGPMTNYTQRFPSLREKLPPEVLESYFATIPANEMLRPFQVRNTSDAFTKLVDGSYLTLTEAGYLVKHFQDIAPEVAKMAKARVPMGDKIWQIVKEIINIPYTTLTNIWDMSGLGRQGRFLEQRYPQHAMEFVKRYFQSFFSERATQRIIKEYQSSPNLERAIAVGKLQITELPSFYEPISAIEEKQIAIPLLEKIPLVGKYIIRPTARSFTASLNWYRMAIVDRAISAADRTGKPLTDAQIGKLCQNVNDMSGRSSLPRAAQEISPFINALFAPRFALSRVKMLGKIYKSDIAIAWASLIATNLLIMNLIKLLHPDAEIDADLRSSDGGKVKIDNTRLDLWAGELPYVRSLVRLATGQTKTSAGHIIPTDYKTELINIIRSRENPLFSLITDALFGKSYIGEEFGAPPRGKVGEVLTETGVPGWMQGMSKEAWNRLGPLTMQDIADALIEEGVGMGITAGILSGGGIGIQTYSERSVTALVKYRDRIAQKEFKKNWQDLSSREQKQITRKYKNELESLGRSARAERGETIGYEYVGRIVEEEKKAGRNVEKMLSKPVQQTLKELGISIGLSRKVGQWIMNDDRYRKYQDLAAQYLRESLDRQINRPNWASISFERRTEIVNKQIETAKKRARNRVVRLSEQTLAPQQVSEQDIFERLGL